MRKTDQEVQKLMKEHGKHGEVGRAARAASMDRKTARKYIQKERLPSELTEPRSWSTRKDPFESDWPEIREMLDAAPELQAKIVLDYLIAKFPDRFQDSHLRTLQRKFRRWRATEGPPKRVYFSQEHTPGEAMQTDFTWGNELMVTIAGEPFLHMMCHSVLPYSNWEWVSVCHSESMASIRRGIQSTLFTLGHVPECCQTDNSTAATHDLPAGKRGFNEEYKAIVQHFGMEPRTIAVRKKEQNGDIESANGVFKRRIRQLLILRRSRDFDTAENYESWLRDQAKSANRGRQVKLKEELAVMRPLSVKRLPEYSETKAKVTSWSTVRVKSNAYSVPSQLIGESVSVRIFETKIEVRLGNQLQQTMERLHGKNQHRINYRHIIESLIRRPGAFQRYRYREDLFPSLVFRKTYDALVAGMSPRKADIEYLRSLYLSAHTMESDVECAMRLLLDDGVLPIADEVKELVSPDTNVAPDLMPHVVDLSDYDQLLLSCQKEGA